MSGSAAASVPPSVSRHALLLVLLCYVVVYGALQFYNCISKSATFDEPLHLTSGALALRQHDFRLDPTHPPLLRLWAALPLLREPLPQVDLTGISKLRVSDWTNRSYALSRQYLFGQGQGDRLIVRARLMIGVFGLVLGLLVFSWAREWLGFGPAVLALGLYTISPNLMAHSGLVTTDAGVVCLMFGAIYFLWRLQRRWSWPDVAAFTAFVALSFAAKFSALILVPLLPVLVLIAVRCGSALTLRRAALLLAGVAGASYLTIWAVYGFRYSSGPAGSGLIQHVTAPVVQHHFPLLGAMLGWVDARHLLPNAFAQGLAWSLASAQQLGGYLNGEMSTDGWWYYFPVAFLVKTPASLLLLDAAGLVFLLRHMRKDTVDLAFVLLPPAAFLAVAMASRINIGVRHILPLYPHVILLAGVAGRAFLADGRRLIRCGLGLISALALLLWAASWPTTIAYFNEFAGGPENGYRYLSDSNIDWGQHLKALHRWMREQKVDRINLAYFGTVDPASYGVYCVYLPGCPPVARTRPPELPGYVAISTTLLNGGYGVLYDGFSDLTPVAVIGGSIRVYWIERWPDAPPEPPDTLTATWHLAVADQLLTETHWPDRAAYHYRAYLQASPADREAWFRLGLALLQSEQPAGAVEAFSASIARDPAPGPRHLAVATLLLKFHQRAEAVPFAEAAARLLPHDAKARELLRAVEPASP